MTLRGQDKESYWTSLCLKQAGKPKKTGPRPQLRWGWSQDPEARDQTTSLQGILVCSGVAHKRNNVQFGVNVAPYTLKEAAEHIAGGVR